MQMEGSPNKNEKKPNPKEIVEEVRLGNKQNLKIEGDPSDPSPALTLVEEGKPKPRRVQLVPCNEFACNSSEAIHLKLGQVVSQLELIL
jgi:hypothetical protein